MVARSGQKEAAANPSRTRSPDAPLLLSPNVGSALPSRPVDRINYCKNDTDLLISIWMFFHSLLSVSGRQTAGVHTTRKWEDASLPVLLRCRRDSVHGGEGAQHHQRVCRPAHVRSTSATKGAWWGCGLVMKEQAALAHLHNLVGVCAECFFQNNETHVHTYPSPSGWLFILCRPDGLQPNSMGCVEQMNWEDTISHSTTQV